VVSGASAGSRINPPDTPGLEIFGIFGQVEPVSSAGGTPDRTGRLVSQEPLNS